MSERPPTAARPLFLLDYDGTLAPIVRDPALARPHPAVPDLLRALSADHPLRVITGRALEDLARLLPVALEAVGLHGAQEARLGGAVRLRMPTSAREALRAWVERAPPSLVPVWGKKVLELRPAGVDKGVVAREITAAFADRTPVYVGDDATDEDAFRALAGDERAVTVKVGEGETAARYRLRDVEAVVSYLRGFLNPLPPSA